MSHILTKYLKVIKTIGLNCRVGIGKTEDKEISKILIEGEDAGNRSLIVNKYFSNRIVIDDVPKFHKVRISNKKKTVLIEQFNWGNIILEGSDFMKVIDTEVLWVQT